MGFAIRVAHFNTFSAPKTTLLTRISTARPGEGKTCLVKPVAFRNFREGYFSSRSRWSIAKPPSGNGGAIYSRGKGSFPQTITSRNAGRDYNDVPGPNSAALEPRCRSYVWLHAE